MFKTSRLPLFLLTLIVTGSLPQAFAGPTVVPVYEEFRHRLIFEKDHVRVMNVNVPPGDTSLYHIHDVPTVYVVINGALLRSQVLGGEWVDPDPAQYRQNGELIDAKGYIDKTLIHRVSNTGEEPFRVVGIMNSNTGKAGAVASDENMRAKSEINNSWFSTRRISLQPGATTDEYRLNDPAVLVQTSDGHSDVLISGHSTAEKTVSGNWSWHNKGDTIQLRNLGNSDVHLVLVEVK